MRAELEKKVNQSIRLLQSIPQDGDIELSYSGGKDSDVILELAKMAGIRFRAIYKNTTIDPPGTIKHARRMGVEIITPPMSFFQLIRKKGLPTRYMRYCCQELKEYKILDRVILGIRRSESAKRYERYKEPEMCRAYPKKEEVIVYFPILEYTNDDVAEFISERGIKCHPLYYDEYGNFHVERRLGCIGCPLASQKHRREEFKRYPKFLRLWIKNHQTFLDTHEHTKRYQTYGGNACNNMFYELFCKSSKQYNELITGGMFPETAIDARRYLEDYFKIDLSDIKHETETSEEDNRLV